MIKVTILVEPVVAEGQYNFPGEFPGANLTPETLTDGEFDSVLDSVECHSCFGCHGYSVQSVTVEKE